MSKWMLAYPALGLLLTACATTSPVLEPVKATAVPLPAAETLYTGGDILTMVGREPRYVEALGVAGGRIVYAGALQAAPRTAATQRVDLGGKTLLPGFIDAHGHIVDQTMNPKSPNLNPPPVSDVSTIPQLIAKMQAYLAADPPLAGKLAIGLGYDDSLLAERRHPSLAELDQISTEHAVMLTHISGHLMAANSRAMALAGVSAKTPNPAGGVIQKDPTTGQPTGIFEEQAGAVLLPFIQLPTEAQRLQSLDEIMLKYASYGITTAEDAISNPDTIAIMLKRRQQPTKPLIDIISYPQWSYFNGVLSGKKALAVEYYKPGYMASNQGRATTSSANLATPANIDAASREKVGVYVNGIKFAGIKISGDGAPVGKTAFLTKPYLHPPHGQPLDYRAYPTLQQDELDAWFDAAYQHDIQIVMHSNGDATADMLIAAVSKAQAKHGKKDLRPVSIHTQWVRRDQIATYQKLGIMPSFFTSHTFYWGDFHIAETVGPERAFAMSAMHYADTLGMKFSNAADAPVVPADILHLTWTAVNRVSRSGVVVGPEERVSPYVALKAVTDYAAYQHFEEASKGTLEAGKLADLVILAQNPLKVDPMTIKDIQVVETIKDGKTVYLAR